MADLTVAYTGRWTLDVCRRVVAAQGVRQVVFDGTPFDLGVSVGGSQIFTAGEIEQARYGIVNLHLAPLPEYRGRYSAGHALANGDREYGVTLHYVDETIDTGPVIAEHRFPLPPGTSLEELRERSFAEGALLFAQVFPLLAQAARLGQRLPARAQDEKKARYYSTLPA